MLTSFSKAFSPESYELCILGEGSFEPNKSSNMKTF